VGGWLFRTPARRPLHKVGFLFAVTLSLALVVQYYAPTRALGPVSWRLVDWVRIGLLLSGASLVERWPAPKWRAGAPVSALAAILLGAWWSIPLRHDLPHDMDAKVSRAESLWDWLRDNARPEWGRLYVADAFGGDWDHGGLSHSHLLVLTAHHVGMPQVGTYYGVVPYKLRWTLSEFDGLFGTKNPSKEWIDEASGKVNAGVIITSSPHIADIVERTDEFDQVYAVSRYAVWKRRDFENRPIAELTPTNHVSRSVARTGDIRFDLTTEYEDTRVLAKTGYHAWWRLEGIAGASLRESPEGFLVVDNIPKGDFHVHLTYVPSRIPDYVSAIGWALLSVWWVMLSVPARRAGLASEGVP
jgi:hypothetical protein